MKPSEIVRRRLAGQFLTGPRTNTPVEVVEALVAVQAQEYAQAKWALALRTRVSTDADAEQAIHVATPQPYKRLGLDATILRKSHDLVVRASWCTPSSMG